VELLVNGKFTDDEIQELSKKLGVKVGRYSTRSIDIQEIIRFIFRDFDAFILLRDGILFTTLSVLTKKAVRWIKNKKKNVEIQIGVELIFKNKDKNFSVNIGIPTKDNDLFQRQLENILTIEFIDTINKGEIVSMTWDSINKKIKIIRL